MKEAWKKKKRHNEKLKVKNIGEIKHNSTAGLEAPPSDGKSFQDKIPQIFIAGFVYCQIADIICKVSSGRRTLKNWSLN